MTDIAALGLSIDSDGVLKASAALDKFVGGADRAGRAADKLSGDSRRASSSARDLASSASNAQSRITAMASGIANAGGSAAAAASQFNGAASATFRMAEGFDVLTGKANGSFMAIENNLRRIGAVPKEFEKVSGAIKITARDSLNLSRQFADIGVTAAMGMSPFLIAIQQGPQLFDILQEKAIMSGSTIGAVFKAVGATIWTAVAPVLPVMTAIAAAAGTIAGAFALGARSINQANGDVLSGLNLTEKQLERVKESGVSTAVTVGDTFKAFFSVVGDRLREAFAGPLKWLADTWNAVLDFITKYGTIAIKWLVGGFVGAVRAIGAAWKGLPGAIGDGLTQAVNFAIKAIESLVNVAIDGLNAVINFANKVPGVALDNVGRVNFATLGNKFEGQGQSLGSAVAEGFTSGLNDAGGMVDRFFADVAARAVEIRRSIILDEAGKAEKGAKEKAGGKTQADQFAELVAQTSREIALIEARTRAVGQSEEAALRMRNQQELLNAAQEKGIVLTSQQRTAILDLAEKLTQAQINLAKAEALNAANESFEKQGRAIINAAERVGLYGQALEELTIYQDLLNTATDGGKYAVDEYTKAQLRAQAATLAAANANVTAGQFMADLTRSYNEAMQAMQAEANALGLSGAALHAYNYEQEQYRRAMQANIDLTPEQIELIKQQGAAYGEARARVDGLAQSLSALNGLMGKGALGDVFKVLTSSNPSATLLGMGGIGSLIGLGTSQGREALDKQKKAMQEALEGVLGKNSAKLAGQLAGVIQSAGIGLSAGQAIVGSTGTAGKIGGALGGILGGIGGAALKGAITTAATGALGSTLGAAVGSAVPVVGTIIGGVLGSLAGSLLKKAQRGSAILSGAGVTGYYGNSSANKTAAGTLGGGIMDTLNALAQQLGGSLNSAAGRTSIGVRDGKYYVDTQGRGYTKSSISGVTGFGTDEKAAVAFAIKDLINDGVLTGLRAGTLDLIKNAKDLEEGIAKALQFEAIMQMLETGSSQLVQQVRAIKAQFSQYIAVMKEAGASVADLTRVQALQQQQINAMIAQAGASYRATFYTDSQNLAFAKNQIKAVLDPLGYGWIDTVAEYMAEVEKAQKDTSEAGLAWLDTLYSLSDAFGTIKAAADAAAAAKKAEAEQRAAEKAANLQQARDNLRQAYESEASALRQTIEAAKEMARSLRDLATDLSGIVGATNEYETALARLRRVGGLAGMGDTAAQQQLASVIDAFLPAARANAATDVDYRRSVALAAQYANSAARAAETQASEGQKQLDALTKQVGLLIDLNDGVMTVAQATQQLVALMGGTPKSVSGGASATAGNGAVFKPKNMEQAFKEAQDRMANELQKMSEKMDRVVVNTGRTSRRLDGWDRQGAMGVTADSVQPVEVVIANG